MAIYFGWVYVSQVVDIKVEYPKTHLCAPTRDHRFGRTAFDQSNNSESNVERTWKTLAYAICTEMSLTQLYQKL